MLSDVSERFLKYVKFDTQSDPESQTIPSSIKQKTLAQELLADLRQLGIKSAYIDENSYVWANIASNSDKDVPVIGFLAHLDTSDSVSGADVNPIIHSNYQGGDIVLPADKTQIIKAKDLDNVIGHDLITTDGTTLLGADDKAGIAEIMSALRFLLAHPEIKHGEIRICFNPDEEIARGTDKFDVEKFAAQFAYTMDGGVVGEIQNESFSADQVVITFHGHSTHPGSAKGKMINSVKIAAKLIDSLPTNKLAPEVTEDREGFIHCISYIGNEEQTVLKFIIRDFATEKLTEYEQLLKNLATKALQSFPGATMEFEITEQYRNMRYVLDKQPEIVEYAILAAQRLNIKPIFTPIRGGTDGSKLSYMGLPTPNLFSGQHNIHSKLEWVSIAEMELAVKMIVTLCQIWEEKS